jgi:hypothetical protein
MHPFGSHGALSSNLAPELGYVSIGCLHFDINSDLSPNKIYYLKINSASKISCFLKR